MPPKRPVAPRPSPPADEYTDEWGIYDPEKAGIPALFKRLGRPVLRAAPSSARRDRRRGLRPERSAEGVGLALNEVRRRAGLLPDEEPPVVAGNPARAMRYALRARAAADQAAAAPYVPPPADAAVPPPGPEMTAAPAPAPVPPAIAAERPVPAPPRKRGRKAAAAESAPAAAFEIATAPVAGAEPVVHAAPTTARPRGRKATGRARPRVAVAAPAGGPSSVPPPAAAGAASHAAASHAATSPAAPVHAAPVVAPPVKPGPPAPSPRRPRGPVPLAAWAHAVADEPPPVRRADPRGFWRGLFRIPAEVALVEYAHGCRIHRLLVEAGDDHVPDFI